MVESESRKISKLYRTWPLRVRFTISITGAHGRMITGNVMKYVKEMLDQQLSHFLG